MARPNLPVPSPLDVWGAQLNTGINAVSDTGDAALAKANAATPRVDATTNAGPSVDVFKVASQSHPGSPAKVFVTPGELFTGGGESHYNPLMEIGFLNEAALPSAAIIIEQDYWNNYDGVWNHAVEFHNAFITAAGVQYRPISWYARYDGSLIDLSFASHKAQFTDPLTGVISVRVTNDAHLLFAGSESLRIGKGGSQDVYTAFGMKFNPVAARYEAIGGTLSGVVASGALVDVYTSAAQEVAAAPAVRRARFDDSGLTVEQAIWGKTKLVIGSNALEISQDGFSILFSNSLRLAAGAVASFGGSVDGGTQVGVQAGSSTRRSLSILPFSAAQSADLLTTFSSGGVAKFAVLPAGTPISEDAAQGLILKDAAATPNYWRVTVSTTGALTTTNLGTARPAA